MIVAETATEHEISKALSQIFNKEWSGQKREIPFSEVFKKRGEILNVNQIPRLKKTQSGDNFAFAWVGIIQLVDYLNDHIEILNRVFIELQNRILEQKSKPFIDISAYIYKVRIDSEILAYLLKTITDKLIMTLSEDVSNIDCIGKLLKNNNIDNFFYGKLRKHYVFLDQINGLNNGYKHTFSNLQLINICSKIEPAMFALYKPKNSTKKETKIYHLICSNALDQFNQLLETIKEIE